MLRHNPALPRGSTHLIQLLAFPFKHLSVSMPVTASVPTTHPLTRCPQPTPSTTQQQHPLKKKKITDERSLNETHVLCLRSFLEFQKTSQWSLRFVRKFAIKKLNDIKDLNMNRMNLLKSLSFVSLFVDSTL